LLTRYTKDSSGRAVKRAAIYTSNEHPIRVENIDPDAVKIARRLRSSGHVAYIVGGAVRDMLLGKTPKDFDIATDAQPNRIRRLFRNSRVIGKRFRLVHVFFQEKIIEVATFRAEHSSGFENHFGEIEEDVLRRDFTANALYYCPAEGTIIDYVGGVKDIRDRRLKPVIPLEQIFTEDPVRMIRAVKYEATTGCQMVKGLRRQLHKQVDLLVSTPVSRMTEEVFKILLSGYASPIIASCIESGMFVYMVPEVAKLVDSDGEYRERLLRRLTNLDQEVAEGAEDRRSRAIAYLVADYLFEHSVVAEMSRIPYVDGFAEFKRLIKPLVPANKDVEMGLVYLVRRRKNYMRTGQLETVAPADRPRMEDEHFRRETNGHKHKKKGRRHRRPSSDKS
jgi:poly(A) polymerase